MEHDRFNPATYMVIDRITGEEVNVSMFIEEANKSGWEKAFAKILAEYINCSGNQSSKLLAYIIKNRAGNNLLLGTQKEIAESAGVSHSVVKRVINVLIEREMIKKVRSGCYMVTPKMIRNGSTSKGVMLLRLWDDL